MDKSALLEQLRALAAQEDALAVAREIAELRTQMEDLLMEEDRNQEKNSVNSTHVAVVAFCVF